MNEYLNTSPQSSALAPAPLVVCSTRGGQGSRAAQIAAIDLARRENARLVFLYVVDETLFSDVDAVMQSALKEELLWIGQSLLQLARNRGRALGVSAETVILEGNFTQQLIAFLRETKPISMVLGAPRGTTLNIFGDDQIEKFAIEIEGETGVDVLLVRPEEEEDNN
ncbi:MAG TPA: universal stress protein [Anaerolineae bacterium]|nr:universal stress protein [Anaerolineae bacterium]